MPWKETGNLVSCYCLLHWYCCVFYGFMGYWVEWRHLWCYGCLTRTEYASLHIEIHCRNRLAAESLLSLTRHYDKNISAEKALLLDINCDPLYALPTILATGLFLIWQNRLNKKGKTLYQIRSEIECLVCLLRRSRSKFLREAGEMVFNTKNVPI